MTRESGPSRRPRLALPFSFLETPDQVRLVAGEDFRYTLHAPGLDRWLPGFLAGLDGRRTLGEALGGIPEEYRGAAARIVDRLYGERAVVDGSAFEAHSPLTRTIRPEGNGPLLGGLEAGGAASSPLHVLVQDRLDYDEVLRFNRRCLEGCDPWLWATIGPMDRGYVSPVFLPTSGPCLGCLLLHFRRRSPAPEIYDGLIEQGRQGKPIQPAPFPGPGVEILKNLILWKASRLADAVPSVSLYRLHVFEVDTLEVTSHRVFLDPECGECRGRRR